MFENHKKKRQKPAAVEGGWLWKGNVHKLFTKSKLIMKMIAGYIFEEKLFI